jgi:hypothetical protein
MRLYFTRSFTFSIFFVKPNRQQSKCYLNLCEVLCIGLIIYTKNKKHALLVAVLISCLTEFILYVKDNINVSSFKSVKFLQATTNNEVLVWDITLQGVSPFSIFFVEQKNKKWIVSKYFFIIIMYMFCMCLENFISIIIRLHFLLLYVYFANVHILFVYL